MAKRKKKSPRGSRSKPKKRARTAQAAPVAERRGIVNEPSGSISWELGLVKAPAEMVAKALEKQGDVERVERSSLDEATNEPSGHYYYLIQLKGHAWTCVVERRGESVPPPSSDDVRLAEYLAQATGCDTILVGTEKHSGEYFESWKRRKLEDRCGTLEDDRDLDQLLRDNDAYAPCILSLDCTCPEDLLTEETVQCVFVVTKTVAPRARRRQRDPQTKALFDAIARNDLEGVQEAIAAGADVNLYPVAREGSRTPLGEAADAAGGRSLENRDLTAVVEALLAAGADPNHGGAVAPMAIAADRIFAAEKYAMAVILTLARAGADLESRGLVGLTPLGLAAAVGKLAATKMLVKLGADPHAGAPGNGNLIDMLAGAVPRSREAEKAMSACLTFLREVVAGEIDPEDIETFDELFESASDDLGELTGHHPQKQRKR